MEVISFQDIILYFIIYSFFGWILESVYKTLLEKKFVNSGFLYGPFCPIYGIGAIIMLLFLSYFANNIILLFLVSVVILSIWEYIVGWMLEMAFNIKYWDYSQNKFNFQGRICLRQSITWGLLGVAFITIIHPLITEILVFIPNDMIKYIIILVLAYMLGDCIYSIVKTKNITFKLDVLREITKNIKEKSDELKGIIDDSHAKKKLMQTIEELKEKQLELKEKIEVQTRKT